MKIRYLFFSKCTQVLLTNFGDFARKYSGSPARARFCRRPISDVSSAARDVFVFRRQPAYAHEALDIYRA